MLLFSIGFLSALAIYHLLIFLRRRNDYGNLAYSLFCIAIIIGKYYGNNTKLNTIATNIIFVVSGFLCIILFTIFNGYFFRIKRLRNQKALNISCLFLGVYLIFVFVFAIAVNNYKILFSLSFPALALFSLFGVFSLANTVILDKIYYDKVKTSVVISFIVMMAIFIFTAINYSFNLPVSSIAFNIGLLLNCIFYANTLSVYINREHTELHELNEKLEEKVKERTQQLDESNQQKTAFFINLAHETKTPLTLVKIYLDKYIEEHGTDENLKIVKNNIDKLTKDMTNFLDAEKIEQGRISYEEKILINFSEYLPERIRLFKTIAQRKYITIIENIEPDLMVYIDPLALDRVINNLIENAIRYNHKQGSVWVGLKKIPDNKILFSVQDNGCGIAEEQQPCIFDKYYQISKQKSNTQGMGMGLFITKSIIDLYKGELRFSSKQTRGSLFEVILSMDFQGTVKKNMPEINPVQQTMQPSDITDSLPVIREIESTAYLQGRESIMLVEDNLDLLSSIQKAFTNEYNVIPVSNSRDALRYLKENNAVDLIVSDIMMDEINGYELRKQIMQLDCCKSIPFIFLTAKSGKEEKLRGLEQGAIDYICKPFDLNELRGKIKNWLMLLKLKHQNFIAELESKHQKKLAIFLKKNNISEREQDVINSLLKHDKISDISKRMCISCNTVKKHIENIKTKLDVKTKDELIRYLFDCIYN